MGDAQIFVSPTLVRGGPRSLCTPVLILGSSRHPSSCHDVCPPPPPILFCFATVSYLRLITGCEMRPDSHCNGSHTGISEGCRTGKWRYTDQAFEKVLNSIVQVHQHVVTIMIKTCGYGAQRVMALTALSEEQRDREVTGLCWYLASTLGSTLFVTCKVTVRTKGFYENLKMTAFWDIAPCSLAEVPTFWGFFLSPSSGRWVSLLWNVGQRLRD
jgi:hypothetical protein